MRSRKSAEWIVALALLLSGARQASATTIDLSWDGCSPLVATKSSQGPQVYSLFVTASNQTVAHSAYLVSMQYRLVTPGGPVPDAWRFDDGGCQGLNRVELRQIPLGAVSKTCPAFQGTGQFLPINFLNYDAAFGRATVIIGSSYPAGVLTVSPATRWFLAGVRFDHSFSVLGPGTPGETCGGFERNLEFLLPIDRDLSRSTWLGLDGTEHPFVPGQSVVTFCGSGCAVPAETSTWGQIKAQYRR